MFQNPQLGQVAQRFEADGEFERRILAGIVEDYHLFHVVPHARWNPLSFSGRVGIVKQPGRDSSAGIGIDPLGVGIDD